MARIVSVVVVGLAVLLGSVARAEEQIPDPRVPGACTAATDGGRRLAAMLAGSGELAVGDVTFTFAHKESGRSYWGPWGALLAKTDASSSLSLTLPTKGQGRLVRSGDAGVRFEVLVGPVRRADRTGVTYELSGTVACETGRCVATARTCKVGVSEPCRSEALQGWSEFGSPRLDMNLLMTLGDDCALLRAAEPTRDGYFQDQLGWVTTVTEPMLLAYFPLYKLDAAGLPRGLRRVADLVYAGKAAVLEAAARSVEARGDAARVFALNVVAGLIEADASAYVADRVVPGMRRDVAAENARLGVRAIGDLPASDEIRVVSLELLAALLQAAMPHMAEPAAAEARSVLRAAGVALAQGAPADATARAFRGWEALATELDALSGTPRHSGLAVALMALRVYWRAL